MSAEGGLETLIVPPIRDLGDGFQVRRALPSPQRRMVGPFVFFDQMGPTVLAAGHGLDVRPHPHIGLATVTYLFDGEIVHRDSLGHHQSIRPGEVNWMVAGRGIVHSERTDPARRATESSLFGIQTWVALPKAQEDCAPSFVHHSAQSLPLLEAEGTTLRLIAGSLYGVRAPAETASELFYADVRLQEGAQLPLPTEHEERAVYLLSGRVQIEREMIEPGQLAIVQPRRALSLRALEPAQLLLLGGAPLDGARHLYWNFVASSLERIEQAKEDWRQGRFGTVPGDEREFIPLPQTPAAQTRPVNYP